MVENVDQNELLAQAFCKVVHLMEYQRGFFLTSGVVPTDCYNRVFLVDAERLDFLLSTCREMFSGGLVEYLGPEACGLEEKAATLSRIAYIQDLQRDCLSARVYGVLLTSGLF